MQRDGHAIKEGMQYGPMVARERKGLSVFQVTRTIAKTITKIQWYGDVMIVIMTSVWNAY